MNFNNIRKIRVTITARNNIFIKNFSGGICDVYRIIYYFSEGLIHNKNGPAIEHYNGGKEWYLNGFQYSEEKYWDMMNKIR